MSQLIDRSLLESYGNDELLRFLLKNFEEKVPERFANLRQAIELQYEQKDIGIDGDLSKTQDLKKLLHAVKNSFVNVGAQSVGEFCQKFEDSVTEMSEIEPQERMNELDQYYLAVKKELAIIVKEMNENKRK